MKLIHERLNYAVQWKLPNMYLFTGNPVVKKNGAIVMGRGAAQQVRDTYPGIDRVFGDMITNNPNACVLWTQMQEKQYLGWFKVKDHWSHDASLALIESSAFVLENMAKNKPRWKFLMNFPGIGNGRLKYEDVLPALQRLPDNVHIYRIAPGLEIEDIPWPGYYKLIVAGSRSWSDTTLMKQKINEFYNHFTVDKPALIIVSGTARGADQAGEWLADKYKIQLRQFPAKWQRPDGSTDKSAGYKRNEQMADYADGAIVFWDGESRGSLHMANIAQQRGMDMWLVRPDGSHTITTP